MAEIEAPPSTEQDGAAQAPAAVPAGNEAKQPEINFERVLAGDEAYTKSVNEQLAGEAPAETPAEEAPKAEAQPAGPDPEEVVETITFRGQDYPVKRKEQKALLQKGRLLDTRLSELSHLIALEKEAPDLSTLARTPEGRKAVIERIRQQESKEAIKEDAIPEVDGYDKADVAAVDKIVQARLKAAGLSPEQIKQQAPGITADQVELAKETALTLKVMQRVDRDYAPKMELLQAIMEKVRVERPQDYPALYNKINDPRVLHPETGEPVFIHFWENVVTPEFNKMRQAQKPAVPAVPATAKKAQQPTGRLAPGAAHSTSSAPVTKDWFAMPQSDFDRAFAEALRRG